MGLGKSKSPPSTAAATPATSPAPTPSKATADESGKGVDYSVKARSYTLKPSLKQLYPVIEPFKTGKLKVDDRHELYWEACGNEKGDPGEQHEALDEMGIPQY
jgi:hypothetical protein